MLLMLGLVRMLAAAWFLFRGAGGIGIDVPKGVSAQAFLRLLWVAYNVFLFGWILPLAFAIARLVRRH